MNILTAIIAGNCCIIAFNCLGMIAGWTPPSTPVWLGLWASCIGFFIWAFV